MEYIFLFLWFIAAFILFINPKNSAYRWGSLALFAVGLRGLVTLFFEFCSPYFKYIQKPDLRLVFHGGLSVMFSKIPLSLFPIAFLMFVLHYNDRLTYRDKRQNRVILAILFIPVILMYFVPCDYFSSSSKKKFLIFADIWALPYIIAAGCFLIQPIFKTGKHRFKTGERLTVFTIFFVSVIYTIIIYVLPIFNYKAFELIPYLILVFLGLFVMFTIKYGFMGMKVSVEKIHFDSAIRTIASEASVLNHIMRNKMMEISACANNIITAAGNDQNSIARNTAVILSATDDIGKTVAHIHHYLDKVTIVPTRLNLSTVVLDVISNLEHGLNERNISFVHHLPEEIIIMGDPDLLGEMMRNILQNSVDALPSGGNIQINFLSSGNWLTLSITDTGCGISKQDLPHILEPFFTTKDPNLHFGLGLSYCYNIMNLHGGSIEIDSLENVGITVFLRFPRHKGLIKI